MKDILRRIIYFFLSKKRYQHRGIYVFRPAMSYISRRAHLSVGSGFYFNTQFGLRRILLNIRPGELYIASGAVFSVEDFSCYAGSRITVNPNGKLFLGTGYMNYNSVIDCSKSITIGRNVKISENVMIRDSDNHVLIGSGKDQDAPIVIEDDVWICMNVTILKGVRIGRGSVVASGAVVTKDIPPYSLAGGVPAKVLKNQIQHE